MRINVKVDTSAFKGNPMPAARRGITNALKNGAEQVRRTAQELAPKDTGELAESIHSFYYGPMKYRIQPEKDPIDLCEQCMCELNEFLNNRKENK